MLRVSPRRSTLLLVLLLALPLAPTPVAADEGPGTGSGPGSSDALVVALGTGPAPKETYACRGDAPFDACSAGPFPIKTLEISMRRWGFVGTLHATATHHVTDRVLARVTCTSHGIHVTAPGPSSCEVRTSDPFPAGLYRFDVSYSQPTVGSFDVTFRFA